MKQAVRWMNEGLKHLLNIMLGVMVIVVFLQVIFRFVIDQPLAWTEELARYLLVWLTFLGAAYAMSKKAHIGVELFINMLSPKLQKGCLVLSGISSCIFFIVVAYQGVQLMGRTMLQSSAAMQLPMGVVYVAIPLGSVILAINVIADIVDNFKKVGV